eukprot:c45651_g1_i1 orf=1-315(-)
MLPQPSIKNLVCIICKCTKARNLALVLRMHAYLDNTRLHAHTSVGSNLVAMLAEVRSMHNALKVFNALTSTKDKSHWDYLINGYIKCGEERHALVMYQKMQRECD